MPFVLQPENELLLHFSDYNGSRSTMEFFIANTEVNPSGGAAAAIAAAAQAISDSFLGSVEILRHATNDAPGTPTNGPYARPADKADITLIGVDGSPVIIQIPGLQEGILASDHITVDPTNSAVAAFLTYAKANFLTSEGRAIVAMAPSKRRRPPRLKKQ